MQLHIRKALTLLHSEWPKLVLTVLRAMGLKRVPLIRVKNIFFMEKKKLKTCGYFNEFQRNHPRQPETEMGKYVLGVLHAQLVQVNKL